MDTSGIATSQTNRRTASTTTRTNVLRTAFRANPSADIVDFQSFCTNDVARVSNTFDGWYQVPLFVFTPQMVRKLRSADGATGRTHRIISRLGSSERSFQVDISPAQLLSRDGQTQSAHYPGPTEERILEALFRLAARPGHGASALGAFAAVRFTYAMLNEELTRHGHQMNHRQISLSLQILNQTRMLIREAGAVDPIYSGSPLPQIVRDTPSEDKREVVLIAEFATPIANLIGKAGYRQIDYERLMKLRHPIARYLYKRLVHNYTYADMVQTHHFNFSAIRDAGLLDGYSARVDKQRSVVRDALDELVDAEVIRHAYDVRLHRSKGGRRSITDVTYTVAATKVFVRDQKAAGKRARDIGGRRGAAVTRGDSVLAVRGRKETSS